MGRNERWEEGAREGVRKRGRKGRREEAGGVEASGRERGGEQEKTEGEVREEGRGGMIHTGR